MNGLQHLVLSLALIVGASAASPPQVALDYGTFRGFNSPSTGADNFLGLPFATAGRLENPVLVNNKSKLIGVQDATKYGPACPQSELVASPLSQDPVSSTVGELLGFVEGLLGNVTQQSEDCLSINVQVPEGTKYGDKLPVLMWIFGGGFELGSSAALGLETTALEGVIYQGANLVARSVQMDKPIIFVSANYRINAFGGLASQEITDAGVANLHLKDQRVAMQWIQKYISKFGGNPDKVTIWGESAGSMSIATHLVLNDGDPEGLFHSAIMMSGGPGKFQNYHRGQEYFDKYADDVGCGNSTDKIRCIRQVPYEVAYAAVQAQPNFFSYNSTIVPWYPRADGKFLKDSPHKLMRKTGIADVPMIIGDMKDEGTLFSLFNQLSVTTDAEFKKYFKDIFFRNATQEQVDKLCDMYPEDPSAGSPFDTGDANAITPQYKRLSALVGDCTFQTSRRDLLNLFSGTRKAWSYQIEDSIPLLGQIPLISNLGISNLPLLGSFHVSDVTLYTFGLVPAALSKNTLNLMSTIISFATTHDPNNHGLNLPYWPQYNTDNKTLFRYKEDGPDLIPDTYREEAFDFQNENGDIFEF